MDLPPEVLERVPNAAPEVLRLLHAAEQVRPGVGASEILDSARDLPPANLTESARSVCHVADDSPHPDHVIAGVVKFFLASGTPMLPADAISGLASMAASDCRSEVARDAAAARIREELAAGGGLLRATTEWKKFVEDRQPPLAQVSALLAAARPADISDLLDAAAMLDAAEPELRAIMLVLPTLMTHEKEASPDDRERWRSLVRERLLGGQGGAWANEGVVRLWAQLDRAAAENELLRRYRETGRLDYRLWYALAPARGDSAPDPRAWSGVLGEMAAFDLSRGRWPWEVLFPWHLADPAAVRRFVLDVQPTALPAGARPAYARALVWHGRDATVRLRELQALGGRDAEEATISLELIGELPPDRIEELASRWRASRASEDLGRLFHTYIDRLPEGAAFDEWLRRLGEDPSTFNREGTWIEPKDAEAGSLYLELDAKGRLRGFSFK